MSNQPSAQLSVSKNPLVNSRLRMSFSVGDSDIPTVPGLLGMTTESVPDREPLRVLLVGSRRGVNNTILTLYRLGFASVSEWSPLLPAPNPGEVMSILTRYIQLDNS
ncbi:MAG: hypothetical protein NZ772_03245 [Cyanobacteria bacterium]|nr:hypothetical protein [Cyanobacteriota bacterium]MDW8200485.1 hypothetical protein [Cyanobacteriota bacterium SKYGB_h_bin112]